MKFSNFLLTNIAFFVAGLFCLLLAVFSIVFNFFALLFLGIAVFMVAITLTKNYQYIKKQIVNEKDEILMERAVEEDGDKYVLNKSPFTKRQDKHIASELRSKLSTIAITYFIAFGLFYMAVKLIILL